MDLQRPLFQHQRKDPCFCGSGLRFKACCGSLASPRLPPHGIHRIARFMAESVCESWVRYFESQHRQPLSINQADQKSESGLRLERDPGRITDVVQQGQLAADIESTVRRAFKELVEPALGHTLAWMEAPQVLRYETGGLYGPHADGDHFNCNTGMWQKVLDRDASLLLYLNRDFSGGELSFPQFNYRYQPETGDLLFFPSNGHYAHQALPVSAGVRYAIVSWAAFHDLPRVQTEPPAGLITL